MVIRMKSYINIVFEIHSSKTSNERKIYDDREKQISMTLLVIHKIIKIHLVY